MLATVALLGLVLLGTAVCGKVDLRAGWRHFLPEPAFPELIRLHVIANSDTEVDQKLKYQVRDAVLEALAPEIATASSAEECRQMLRQRLPEVKARAQQVVYDAGFSYGVGVEWGVFAFPARFYGEVGFPAGRYEAVRVVIGEGRGANWWCVLYPPLCFIGPVARPIVTPEGEGGGRVAPESNVTPEEAKEAEGARKGKIETEGREALWPAMAGAATEKMAASPLQLRSKLWEWYQGLRK